MNTTIQENILSIKGQGTYTFRVLDVNDNCEIEIYNNKNSKQCIHFTIGLDEICINIDGDNIISSKNIKSDKGLIDIKGIYYWISLDSQNQVISFGMGETRVETRRLKYKLDYNNHTEFENNKTFLDSLTTIRNTKNAKSIKLCKDPVVNAKPLFIKDTNELTMNDIAEDKYLPNSFLSSVNQQLYNCVSGKKFLLDDDEFPDFSKAIEYSINTEGCWCNTTLQKKSTEFNPSNPNINETYLRITLGNNCGESPGIPYVMEIWPPNYYSPIHKHADANAIIRVLHGSINVKLFPFLSQDLPHIEPFSETDFHKDDITWISPQLNQVHQLTNKNSENACVTIQCYTYSRKNLTHYEYFDYLNDNGNICQYEPDSDKDFVEFKKIIKEEWQNR